MNFILKYVVVYLFMELCHCALILHVSTERCKGYNVKHYGGNDLCKCSETLMITFSKSKYEVLCCIEDKKTAKAIIIQYTVQQRILSSTCAENGRTLAL